MAGWAEYATYVADAVSVALAAFLLIKGRRTAIVYFAAVLIGIFGLAKPILLLGAELDWSPGARAAFGFAILGVFFAANTAFVASYPSFPGRGWRAALLGFSLFPLGLGMAGLLVLALSGAGAAIAYVDFANDYDGIFLDLPTVAFAAMVLGTAPGLRRTQLVFVFLPNLVHTVNHAALMLEPVMTVGADPDGVNLFYHAMRTLIVVGVLTALLVQAVRRADRRRQNLTIVSGVLASTPLAFLQFLDPELHGLVDFLFVVLLFYGIARYQVVEVDFSWASGMGKALRGAVALPAFFIAQKAVENLADATLGLFAGTVVAGLTLFALELYHRRHVARASTQVPARDPLGSYEAFRRVEIYRAAVEVVIADGRVLPRESKALGALRTKIGLTDAEHDAIERDVRNSLSGA